MKIEDIGFITFIKKFEENSLLLKLLSKENGLISGYVKHIKKDKYSYQIGNLVKFNWTAKDVEQLGTLKVELVKSNLSSFIDDRFYLSLIELINSIINNLLYERYLENRLFKIISDIFDLISKNEKKQIILKEYFIFENTILNVVGSGIIFDMNEKIENLYYISPKTGLAVSKLKGDPFKDRLLKFPSIFKRETIDSSDIFECFEVMEFFLKRYFNENNYLQKYKNISLIRLNLLDLVTK